MYKVTITYANSKVTGNFASLLEATAFVGTTAEGHGDPSRITLSHGEGAEEEPTPKRKPGRPRKES